jgi:hypothetical protein
MPKSESDSENVKPASEIWDDITSVASGNMHPLFGLGLKSSDENLMKSKFDL